MPTKEKTKNKIKLKAISIKISITYNINPIRARYNRKYTMRENNFMLYKYSLDMESLMRKKISKPENYFL